MFRLSCFWKFCNSLSPCNKTENTAHLLTLHTAVSDSIVTKEDKENPVIITRSQVQCRLFIAATTAMLRFCATTVLLFRVTFPSRCKVQRYPYLRPYKQLLLHQIKQRNWPTFNLNKLYLSCSLARAATAHSENVDRQTGGEILSRQRRRRGISHRHRWRTFWKNTY